MKKIILPLSIACIMSAAMFFPALKSSGNQTIAAKAQNITSLIHKTAIIAAKSSAEVVTELYDSLNLNSLGLSEQALQYAYKGYEFLKTNNELPNANVITICDFSQSSRNRRMYVIDIKNFKVLMNTYVAHGKNSGVDFATKFSNKPESLQSSLGFYVTEGTYLGKHGLSLRINGLERGWNDKAEERAVVVHGAEYIGNQRLGTGFMGRSFGCPAVPQSDIANLINLIKDGTCLFIYNPNQNYLHDSKILNG